MEIAKKILEANQYPPQLYDPIIKQTLNTLLGGLVQDKQQTDEDSQVRKDRLVMLQYRGKTSKDTARFLHKIKAPCRVVMTLRKLKTVLPSLKPGVDRMLKSSHCATKSQVLIMI